APPTDAAYNRNPPDHDGSGRYTDVGRAGQPQVRVSEIADGASNTLMAAEVIQGQGTDLRGFTWWGGSSGFTAWSVPNANEPDVLMGGICNALATCPPPPSPGGGCPCTTISTNARPRMMAARSRHNNLGGVNAAYCDGHVAFITNGINITVWRALSTSQGGEVITTP